ncbi:MAG: hypothetical protein PF483_15660 [Halothiobacillus sp.]|nr:hypothetical protein [Halothiobacillus sp.]
MSDIPPIDEQFLAKLLKGCTSVRQVKQNVDVAIRHAKKAHPLMRVH